MYDVSMVCFHNVHIMRKMSLQDLLNILILHAAMALLPYAAV